MEKNYSSFTSPEAPTVVATYDATVSTSTAINLNAKSTYIEVTAIDKGIFLKWNGTASSSAFDEYINQNTTRTYKIPTGATTANFIQQSATAILVVLEK
jgi:hypothetical protein